MKNFIVICLAIVTYLIVMQWQEDYGQLSENNDAQKTQQSNLQINDEPKEENSNIQNEPQFFHNSLTLQPDLVGADEKAVDNGELITINTNVFTLKVDPLGGDIVSIELLDYPVSVDQPNIPFRLLNRTAAHTYIAQSGLIGAKVTDKPNQQRPMFTSSSTEYSMGNQETLVVDLFFLQENGVKITKRLMFSRDRYLVNIDVIVDNTSTEIWSGAFFAQIRRDGSADPGLSTRGLGLPTFLGAAYWDEDEPYNKMDFDDFYDEPLNKTIQGGWLAFSQHYFMSAWIPDQSKIHHYQTRAGSNIHIISYITPQVQINAGEHYIFSNRFYAGPKILKKLESIEPDKDLALLVDYGPLFFISKPLYLLLNWLYSFVNNWGVAIILLTLTVKILFFPLSASSYRSMANMRRVTPKLNEIRARHADDRQRASKESMKFLKEEGINPLAGYLPILVQLPVFLALYWALLESVELRQAPFFGWLTDLSVMDPFFILPIILVASSFILQMFNPPVSDPIQAKTMKIMPFIFGLLFLFSPSGLVLYWVINNLFTIAGKSILLTLSKRA